METENISLASEEVTTLSSTTAFFSDITLPEMNGKAANIFLLILTIGFIIVIILGNICTLLVIRLSPELRTPADVLVASLAVSDFLTGVGGVLKIVTQMVTSAIDAVDKEGLQSKMMCVIFMAFGIFTIASSICCLVAMSADRLFCIAFPLIYRTRKNARTTNICLIVIWLTALLISISTIIFSRYTKDAECLLSKQTETWITRYFLTAFCLGSLLISGLCYAILGMMYSRHVKSSKKLTELRHHPNKAAGQSSWKTEQITPECDPISLIDSSQDEPSECMSTATAEAIFTVASLASLDKLNKSNTQPPDGQGKDHIENWDELKMQATGNLNTSNTLSRKNLVETEILSAGNLDKVETQSTEALNAVEIQTPENICTAGLRQSLYRPPGDKPVDENTHKVTTRKRNLFRRSPISATSVRLLKTILITQGAFFICFVPQVVVMAVYEDIWVPDYVYKITSNLAFFNSGVNIFIYYFHNTRYGNAYRKVLRKKCCG